MIANPKAALYNTKEVIGLSVVMAEVMKPYYPAYDEDAWLKWAAQYKTFQIAKRCAISTFIRCLNQKGPKMAPKNIDGMESKARRTVKAPVTRTQVPVASVPAPDITVPMMRMPLSPAQIADMLAAVPDVKAVFAHIEYDLRTAAGWKAHKTGGGYSMRLNLVQNTAGKSNWMRLVRWPENPEKGYKASMKLDAASLPPQGVTETEEAHTKREKQHLGGYGVDVPNFRVFMLQLEALVLKIGAATWTAQFGE
jgi:hypothetical protein